METKLSKDELLYGLRCPDDLLRRECWAYFCTHYREEKGSICDVKSVDFNLQDNLGNPVYSKSEMYDAFLVMLLNDSNIPQGNEFVSLLQRERNYELSIPYLIDIISRVENPKLAEECIPILHDRIRTNSNMKYLLKLLENTDENNYQLVLPIVIEELSHISMDFDSISQIHMLLQQRFLRKVAFREYGFSILKTLVTNQVHPFLEHRALLWQSFTCGIRYNTDYYNEYLQLFRSLVMRAYQNAEVHSLRVMVREPQSPFNNGCFNIYHLIDILSEIKDEPVHQQKFPDLFWSGETYSIITTWLENNILTSDEYAAYALPLLQHLACQIHPRQGIKLYRLVEKILYARLWDYSVTTHNSSNTTCRWRDFFYIRKDCPDFLSSYGLLLGAILHTCQQELNEKSFIEMCSVLSETNNADIQDIGSTLFRIYLNLPGQLNLTLENLVSGQFYFSQEKFLCQELGKIQFTNQEVNHEAAIAFLHRMMHNINDAKLKETIFKTAQNLFNLFKTEFSQEELQNYHNIESLYSGNNAVSLNMPLYSQLKTYFKR